MAWFKGTATDYQDFLNQLANLVQDDHISAATVANGGTGYALGDTITLAGGTKNHEPEIEVISVSSGDYVSGAAVNAGGTGYAVGDKIYPDAGTYSVTPELEVTSESSGVVTGLQINNPGICSATPSNPVATTSDGSGTGLTVDLTFTPGTGIITGIHISDAGVYTSQASNPVSQNTSSGSGTGAKFTVTYTDTAWEVKIDYDAQEASAVAISVAGTGYTADDVVTIVGGTFTEACTVKIDTVSSGVPTAVSLVTAGEYSSTPSNPASTSGGTGTGLTLTMTWGDAADETKYLMIHNTTSDQYLGWRGFKVTSPDDAYMYELCGFTGFNSLSTPWDEQPGSSSPRACYIALSGGASPATIYYWISVQDTRIVGAFKVGSVYPNMYLGELDTYLTDSEYAYSQLLVGCLVNGVPYDYSGLDYCGMDHPGASSSNVGPGHLRSPDGSWVIIQNWYLSSGVPTTFNLGGKIQPGAGCDYSAPSSPNNWYSTDNQTWTQMFTDDVSISSNQDSLKGPNGEFTLIPCTVVNYYTSKIYGNMRGVFKFNPAGLVTSESRILVGTDRYRAFSNCGKTNRNFFFAIKEE